ncbi:MAG: AAA family ATPase [Tannerellaceae bacterium]|nr:AAA family ATPase [Tannerellaceae bacterium]
MEKLYERFKWLLDQTNTTYLRYLHGEVDWNSRMTAIVGARGVGKTTMLLQHIKLNHNLADSLYINADDLYFSNNKLFDLASTFHKNGGKHLFIDEIHKYEGWSKELKMMYDYFPDMQVVFTGSSILDIYKGTDDLSRRVLTHHLWGMSFREYLNMSRGLQLPVYTLQEIVGNRVELKEIAHPLPVFKEYVESGYYPFYKETGYSERIRNVVHVALETDIPFFAGMNVATAKKMKQLLYIISQSAPFKPNFTKISEMIDIHRNQVVNFLWYLEKAGIISQLRNSTKGIRLLGKVEKVYLGNTNLIYSLAEGSPNIGNLRETLFFSQMAVRNSVFSSEKSDFQINDYTFEVGGKGKGQKQIEGIDNAFVVKDDIEYGYGNIVPLWAFGFNY